MNRIISIVFATLCVTLSIPQASASKESVSLMTFNVENLFNATHDPGKNDYSYLPIEEKQSPAHIDRCNLIPVHTWRTQCLEWDWSNSVLAIKVTHLTQAILAGSQNQGPDVLFLQEVENYEVAEKLRSQLNLKIESKALYYPPILIEGDDARGIDIAILTKLPVAGVPRLERTQFSVQSSADETYVKDTRGILRVDVQLPNQDILTLFGVHFPAQHIPQKFRLEQAEHLRSLVNALPKRRLAIAAGDFNVSSEEDQLSQMYQKIAGKEWLVSHQEGCDDCQGTYFYNEWSFLDAFLVRKLSNESLHSAWRFLPESVRVANTYEEHRQYWEGFATPRRFRLPSHRGVSDHWPLVMELHQD